jgi:protein-tyrosine-phosphatase
MISDAGRTDIETWSAGTNAWDGSPASDGALLVGIERGLDLSEHRSRLLTREIVAESDLILVMAPSHLARVKELEPSSNAHMLSTFATGNEEGQAIQDPFGGDLTAYRDAFEEIEHALSGLLDKIPAT